MHFNKIKFLLFSVLVLINFSFSQDDCEDVGAGGFSCDQILIDFVFPCEGDFAGSIVSDVCPVSCDACPDSEGTDGITDGCDLPDNNLYLLDDGSVLYNSTDAIGGFQFNVDGASVTGGSGGAAADA